MELVLLALIRLIFGYLFLRAIFRAMIIKVSNPQKADSVKQNMAVNSEPVVQEIDVIAEVSDPVCGKLIKKDDAYIIMEGGKPQYFCSWECRQKYAAQMNQQLQVS